MSAASSARRGAWSCVVLRQLAVIVGLVAVPFLSADSALAQEEEVITISGVVTANGRTVGEGIDVQLVDPDTVEVNCGIGRTNATGRFAVDASCTAGTQYKVQLPTQALASETIYMAGPAPISVNFPELADEQLGQLGITVAPATTEQQQSTNILESWQLAWILAAVVIAAGGVLVLLAILAKKNGAVKKQTEAMVLVAVIIAIIILGVTGKIGSDGLVSVLAAIVGWGAARAANGEETGASGRGPASPSPNSEEPGINKLETEEFEQTGSRDSEK